MITLEARHRAAQPLRRHQPEPQGMSLICMRCERHFTSPVIACECWNCTRASERVYGDGRAIGEASGS